MKQTQWVNAFCEKYGCTESAAHNAFYSANHLSYRKFLARWAEGLPGDSANAHYWWVKAREREPIAKRCKRLRSEKSHKARRRAYYLKRRAQQDMEAQEAMRQAQEVARAMRARSMGKGVDPDREGEFPVIPRRRGRRLTH